MECHAPLGVMDCTRLAPLFVWCHAWQSNAQSHRVGQLRANPGHQSRLLWRRCVEGTSNTFANIRVCSNPGLCEKPCNRKPGWHELPVEPQRAQGWRRGWAPHAAHVVQVAGPGGQRHSTHAALVTRSRMRWAYRVHSIIYIWKTYHVSIFSCAKAEQSRRCPGQNFPARRADPSGNFIAGESVRPTYTWWWASMGLQRLSQVWCRVGTNATSSTSAAIDSARRAPPGRGSLLLVRWPRASGSEVTQAALRLRVLLWSRRPGKTQTVAAPMTLAHGPQRPSCGTRPQCGKFGGCRSR